MILKNRGEEEFGALGSGGAYGYCEWLMADDGSLIVYGGWWMDDLERSENPRFFNRVPIYNSLVKININLSPAS
jgi:hypothetical protein